MYFTAITWTSYAKIHSRAVTTKLSILQSMVSHKVTGYTVNKLTGYTNTPYSLPENNRRGATEFMKGFLYVVTQSRFI